MTLSLAQGADLVREWTTFSDLPKGDSLLTGATCNEDGSLSVKRNHGTHKDRPTVNLAGSDLSLTDGVTITFNAKGFETHNNVAIISLASDDNEFLFCVGSGMYGITHICFNGSVNNVLPNGRLGSLVPNTEYAYFTLTSQEVNGKCTFTLYRNGKQVGEAYAPYGKRFAASPITRLTLGGWSGDSNNSMTAVDINQLAIYKGAMSQDEVKELYNDFLAGPKPFLTPLTYAGISAALLLLAGAAFIFRRK